MRDGRLAMLPACTDDRKSRVQSRARAEYVLPAHSAVMSRPGFYLVVGKAVKERTGHHTHRLRPRNRILLTLPIPMGMEPNVSMFQYAHLR